MFDSTKEELKEILKQADSGKLQLPDFQRSYVWGDEDVRSLLASVAKGFPVGALLTLSTGGAVKFKPRMLEGSPDSTLYPEELLLDGQQRITSLYQATFSKLPVKTRTEKNFEVERFYYFDIKKAVASGANIEEAIVAVPADRQLKEDFGKTVKLDLSTRGLEFERDMFPLNQTFDSHNWFFGWRDHWKAKGRDVGDLHKEFYQSVLERLDRYQMPLIRLDKKNSREAICLVFEKVNVGGKKLDAFELVTAVYAAEGYDLREDWGGYNKVKAKGRQARIIGNPHPRDVLREVASTDVLQACTLLHTIETRSNSSAAGKIGKELPQVSCRRDALLALPLSAYQKNVDAVELGFVEAGKFLNENKIIWHRDVPYPPQLVALAATFASLGKDAQNAAAKEKLARWFWTISLGEQYGSSTESKLARDVPDLIEWVKNGTLPRSVSETIFQQDRLKTLRLRLSAAYKAIHALLMRHGCRDFISGKPTDIMTFFDEKIDIHHVFPKAWCIKQGIKPGVFNSIINKTPLSKKTNILISGDAPSVYLKRIEDKHKIKAAQLDEILKSHLINPDLLRADDFEAHFKQRSDALATLVGSAMGKSVITEAASEEVSYDAGMDVDEDEDELENA